MRSLLPGVRFFKIHEQLNVAQYLEPLAIEER